jgi:hypothetical protein
MSNSVFPNLPGLMWGFTRSRVFDTVLYPSAAPGYETAISKGPDPTFLFKLQYEFLRNKPSLDELSTLIAFFDLMKGAFDSFLLDLSSLTKNPADASITGQVLTVDANNYAPLVQNVTTTPETIYEVNAIAQVKANGVVVPPTIGGNHNVAPTSGHWSYWDASPTRTYGGASYPGVVIQFGSAPAAPVTIDFSWYYRVRFEKDNADFDAFMFELYELQEISLVTRRNL